MVSGSPINRTYRGFGSFSGARIVATDKPSDCASALLNCAFLTSSSKVMLYFSSAESWLDFTC